MIEPTIGRIVLVWIADTQEQAYPGMISYVHNNTLINLGYLDENGIHHCIQKITLHQDGPKPSYPYAEWMSYQKGQAAKYEQLENIIKNIPLPNALKREGE